MTKHEIVFMKARHSVWFAMLRLSLLILQAPAHVRRQQGGVSGEPRAAAGAGRGAA